MDNFNHKNIEYWDLKMHVMKIGYNGYNLVKKLEEDSRVNCVTIRGNIYDSVKIKFIIEALKNTQVKILNLYNNNMNSYAAQSLAEGLKCTNITHLHLLNSKIGSEGAKYLADALKDTNITNLCISFNNIEDEGAKHLAECLKDTKVISLNVANNGIKSNGIQYLSDALKYNLISIDLGNSDNFFNPNQIVDEAVRYLSEHLKDTNLSHLGLDFCKISNRGVDYLANHLQDSCITSLSLKSDSINNLGLQRLTQVLQDTTIIKLDLYYHNIESGLKTKINEAISQNITTASKIQDTFKKLVVQNTCTYDLEFTVPTEIKNLDITEYAYIIQVMIEHPNAKGYIFNIIKKNYSVVYPDIVNKVNAFIATMPTKFNTFFDDNISSLVKLCDNSDFVKLVQQFENIKLSEVVENLLLHRVLYYVDENQEILYPYIYKMLDKYNMPLYNEQLEPNKKEKIISYYQDHKEIDGAEEINDLLGCKNQDLNLQTL